MKIQNGSSAVVLLILACAAVAGCGDSSDSPPVQVPSEEAGIDAEEQDTSQGGAGGNGGQGGGQGDASQEETGPAPVVPVVDLRADVNRDGVVDVEGEADDTAEDTWDKTHGAIFLANLDDDELKCPKEGTDVELAQCHDAADEVINGNDDLEDLARLKTKPWKDAPDDAKGSVSIAKAAEAYVRLFTKQTDGTFKVYASGAELSAKDLREGVEFAMEGRDIVRDSSVWDGYADVTLTVTYGTSDKKTLTDVVRMRLSPVMTQHHLMPVDTAYVTYLNEPDSQVYRAQFAEAVIAAQVPNGVEELEDIPGLDQWTQDFFEVGFMSMPAKAGEQHAVRVYYRSANVDNAKNPSDPLREAGKVVFTHFRGKDVAAVQEFDLKHDSDMDSLNSFGNTETVPPYGEYPLGRVLRGSAPSFFPDPKFSKLLESQKVQPPLLLDTSWLLVGHVDEVISFAKATSARGWLVLANDPRMAKKMLEDEVAKGNGAVKMFVGKKWFDENYKEVPAEVTIEHVLADTDVMGESAKAAVEVDSMIDVLKKETGITDQEIVHVPFLHWPAYGYSLAYQPGTVNSTYLSDTRYAVPDPHGPVIDGKDIFKVQLEEALKAVGIEVSWVENWDLYHRLEGEVHCGSNVKRQITGAKWWESGR